MMRNFVEPFADTERQTIVEGLMLLLTQLDPGTEPYRRTLRTLARTLGADTVLRAHRAYPSRPVDDGPQAAPGAPDGPA